MQLRCAYTKMADVWCVCVLLAFYILHASCFSGSGFLCRDPDTGKLHAVNSTWSSTTFCGNYTCKIRKKNMSLTEYAPMRQFNISNLKMFMNDSQNNNKNQKGDRMTDSVLEVRDKEEKNIDKDKPSEADRYLTEDEIKTITQILHLVKKSDMDALIEIYELAQDIYREIDPGSVEKPVDTTLTNPIDTPFYRFRIDQVHNKPSSYWYGPLNSLIYANSKDEDMENQASNTIMSVAKSDKADAHFNGYLHSNEIRRVSYYYPMSDFQRSTSYTHSPSVPVYYPTPPCNKKIEEQNKGNGFKKTAQNNLRPAIYLPYPFSYIRRFNSSYPDIYFKYNFGNYAFYTQNNKNPYLRNYVTQIPVNPILVNPFLTKGELKKTNIKEKKETEKKMAVSENIEENKQLAAWQTPPLSKDVIEDIKANVKDTMKILKPWRRNIKLERVANVINLEKIMRSKRDTLEVIYEPEPLIENQMHSTPAPAVAENQQEDSTRQNVLLELVVEKVTCSANDTTPGYFRHGNSSQPFPGCCPQRINSR